MGIRVLMGSSKGIRRVRRPRVVKIRSIIAFLVLVIASRPLGIYIIESGRERRKRRVRRDIVSSYRVQFDCCLVVRY